MNAKPAADLLVRPERVRTMDPMAGPVTALAIRDGKIAVTAGPGEERDPLETWNGPETVMLDDAGLVVLPAVGLRIKDHLRGIADNEPDVIVDHRVGRSCLPVRGERLAACRMVPPPARGQRRVGQATPHLLRRGMDVGRVDEIDLVAGLHH
jgi:hypothetical protein